MKKSVQLGMKWGTASHRMVKDLLFSFVQTAGHKCYRCGGELSRETFSIDHKVPWLDSKNPAELFFCIENIAYSHKSCNTKAARKPTKQYFSPEERRQADISIHRRANRKWYTKEKRREHYRRTGK